MGRVGKPSLLITFSFFWALAVVTSLAPPVEHLGMLKDLGRGLMYLKW